MHDVRCPEGPDPVAHTPNEVIFQPDGARALVPPGATVLEAAEHAGVPLEAPCGGAGVCGKCRVILNGDAPEPTAAEREIYTADELDAGWRSACQHPVDAPLVVKRGGHEDQLSRRFSGMDRFRIRAIVKVIESGVLSSDQKRAALHELSVKCMIYGKGCIKRGRKEEGYYYLSLCKEYVT